MLTFLLVMIVLVAGAGICLHIYDRRVATWKKVGDSYIREPQPIVIGYGAKPRIYFHNGMWHCGYSWVAFGGSTPTKAFNAWDRWLQGPAADAGWMRRIMNGQATPGAGYMATRAQFAAGHFGHLGVR